MERKVDPNMMIIKFLDLDLMNMRVQCLNMDQNRNQAMVLVRDSLKILMEKCPDLEHMSP